MHVGGTDYHLPVGEYNWYVAVIDDSLVRWSVPLFVMISGVLFLEPTKTITYSSVLRKYVARLIKVYVFWYLVYLVINTFIASLSNGYFGWDLISFNPQFHLWFLPMLAGVYLLIPILRRIANDEKLLHYSLILWGCYAFISYVIVVEVPPFSELFIMNWIVGYAGYFLLGYFLSRLAITKKIEIIIYLLGLFGVFVTIGGSIGLSLYHGVGDEKFLFNIGPQVIIMAIALFILVKNNASKISGRIIYFVEYIRKDLFGIYLVHGIWLFVFNRSFFRDILDHTITLPLITVVIFICSLYTTKLLRQIPLMQKVIE